jgi:peptidoglycan/LPS O-acetylase OafA/YrhL
LLSFTWFGFLGVQIFFVISGFVISYSSARASPSNFLIGRVVRLYPSAWICATISTIALGLVSVESPSVLLRGYVNSLTLYPLAPWADAVYWTLGIEMVFYAAVLCLLTMKVKVEWFGYLMGGCSAIYWIVGYVVAPGFLSTNLWTRWLELSLTTYGIYFALGILFYSLREKGISVARVMFGALLLVATVIEIHFKAGHTNWVFHSTESQFVPIAIFLIAVGAIFVSLYWNASGRAFRILGLTTYPLYLVHDNFGFVLMRLSIDAGMNRFAALGASIAICVAASLLIAAYLEPMVQTLLRAALNGKVELRSAKELRAL